MTWANIWPVLSLVINCVMALAIYSLKSTIEIAILKALQSVAREFATKEDVQKLRDEMMQRVDLAGRIDDVRKFVAVSR